MFNCFPVTVEGGTRQGHRVTLLPSLDSAPRRLRALWRLPAGGRRRFVWIWSVHAPISVELRLLDESGAMIGDLRRVSAGEAISIGVDPQMSPSARAIEVDVVTTDDVIGVVALPFLGRDSWLLRLCFDARIAGNPPQRVAIRNDFGGLVQGRAGLPSWWPRRAAREAPGLLDWAIAAAEREESEHPLPPGSTDVPLISFVVPVYDAAPHHLDDLLASFRRQDPTRCELILSDDASPSEETRAWLRAHAGEDRVKVHFAERNGGIAAATNAGIALATGDWVALLDHDDAITAFAVSRIARALIARPQTLYLHTDEVITDGDLRPTGFFFKPAWDPVLLSGVNYVNHLSVYRRDRLLACGCLGEGYQGSQDYELVLRYTAGLTRDQITHVPYPAYLWRRSGETYSVKFLETATANARRALSLHLGAGRPLQITGAVEPSLHRPRFDLDRPSWPKVSVIVPNRDAHDLISVMLDGLMEKTDYPTLEVIVIDNGSTDPRTLGLYERLRGHRVPFEAHVEVEPFNFSRSINKGLAKATGDIMLLANNDLEVVEPGWLKEMVSCFDYPDVGIVGAKLLYPTRHIQHAGVIAGLGGLAGHWFLNQPENHSGPMGRLWVRQSLTVVTGACLAVSRGCLETIGGFNETDFAIAYNDVDFCLRAHAAGFRTVWTPFATLIHHESATRGSDQTPANIERFHREQEALRRIHGTQTFRDPALNPWYSRDRSIPVPIRLPNLPPPW